MRNDYAMAAGAYWSPAAANKILLRDFALHYGHFLCLVVPVDCALGVPFREEALETGFAFVPSHVADVEAAWAVADEVVHAAASVTGSSGEAFPSQCVDVHRDARS